MTPRLPRGCVCLACALLVVPAAAWAGPVVDGQNIPSEFGAGALLSSQRFQTGFGDDTSGNQWGWGSELDQLYVTNDDTYLYIGLSGNLENNGNCIVVFIDVDEGATGANTLYTRTDGGITPIPGLPRFLAGDAGGGPGLDNIKFDTGFAANYVLGWSGGSPTGSQTRTYYLANWTTLDTNDMGEAHTNEIAGMITSGDPTASGPSGTLGDFLATASLGILGASDNAGVDGVEAWDDDPNDPNDCPLLAVNDPATQTTGFEFAIPLSLLGVGVDDTVCLFALVSGTDGWISNQLLPPGESEVEFCNIGNGNGGTEVRDFALISGNQFACYTLAEAPEGCPNPGDSGRYCLADIVPNNSDGVWNYADDGDCIIALNDLAQLLGNYGNTAGMTREDGDIEPSPDGDGDVDLSDLAELLGQYGDNCN